MTNLELVKLAAVQALVNELVASADAQLQQEEEPVRCPKCGASGEDISVHQRFGGVTQGACSKCGARWGDGEA